MALFFIFFVPKVIFWQPIVKTANVSDPHFRRKG